MAKQNKKENKQSKKHEHKYAAEETFENLEHTAQRAEGFLEKNAKTLGYVFGGLILVAVGYFAYLRFYQEPRNQEASQEITQADTYFKQDSMALALNGSAGSYMGYQEISDDFGGTNVGNLAKYKAAIALYQTGDYEGALKKFKSFKAKEQALKAMRQGGIGDCHVQLGDMQKGLEAYEKAVNETNLEVLQNLFTRKAAIVALDLGDFDRGLKTIEMFEKNYPDTKDPDLLKLAERLRYSTK